MVRGSGGRHWQEGNRTAGEAAEAPQDRDRKPCVDTCTIRTKRSPKTVPWNRADDQTADAIKLSSDESWSLKKSNETTHTTAIMARIRPYSMSP